MEVRPGVRIRLISMPNDPAPIPVGSTGTVESVTSGSFPQIWVNWDNGLGRSLAMIPGVDIFQIIQDSDSIPTKAPPGKIKLPAAVLEGILAVRKSGKTNMLDISAVERIARDLGFENAADWLSDPAHKKTYSQGVFKGFEPGE